MEINNLTNDIELVWSATEIDTVPKLGLRTRIYGDFVILILPAGDSAQGSSQRGEIKIDYSKVTVPAGMTTPTILRDQILSYSASAYSAGGSTDADFKVASWSGNVAYATSTSIVLTGSYPAINYNSQIVYIRYTSALGVTSILQNGQSGVSMTHAGGVITVTGAGTPFAAGDSYEVGINAVPPGVDLAADLLKTIVRNMSHDHYTDPEPISETNLGIDAVALPHPAAPTVVLRVTGATYTPEDVAEGFTVHNPTDNGCNALIDVDSSGLPGDYVGDGGAGYDSNAPGAVATDISHAALAGGVNNFWSAADAACIPECKRFVIPFASYIPGSFQVLLRAGDGNKCWVKIYSTNDPDAVDTDDTYWDDRSVDIFGAATISADNLAGVGGLDVYHGGHYLLDVRNVVLKYMIKIVGEFVAASGQDNAFDIKFIKAY
jgi:hypothetical protein